MKKRIDKNIGYTIPGEGAIVINKNLFFELNDYSYSDYIFFIVTNGKKIEEKNKKLFYENIKSCGFTDPRLWSNRISGYCGYKNASQGLSFAASNSAIDSKFFGVQVIIRVFRMIKNCENLNKEEINNYLIKEFKKPEKIPGFSRVFKNYDDRAAFLVKEIKKNNLMDNKYAIIGKKIQDVMFEKYDLIPNGGYMSSLCLLITGITEEISVPPLTLMALSLTSIPSYHSGFQNNEKFIKIYDNEIVYNGVDDRNW